MSKATFVRRTSSETPAVDRISIYADDTTGHMFQEDENGVTIDLADNGESNTASNVGGFAEVFKQKTGIDLEFRTLQSSDSSVTITENTSDIDFTVASSLTEGLVVQARKTDAYSWPTTLQAVSFTTAEESNASRMDWDIANPTRITTTESGSKWYLITYYLDAAFTNGSASDDPIIEAQVKKNGSTLLVGSESSMGNHYSFSAGRSEDGFLSHSFYAQLSGSDYIELYAKLTTPQGSTTAAKVKNPNLTMQLVETLQGEKGDDGAGSNVSLEDEGTPVTGTPHDTLDFVGAGVTVTNAGSGEATITIPGSTFGSAFEQSVSEGQSTTTSGIYVQKLKHTTSSLASGNYIVYWFAEVGNSGSDHETSARCQLDDTTTIAEQQFATKIDDVDCYRTFGGFYYWSSISGAHDIDIDFYANSGTAEIRRARIAIWRIS